MRSRGEGSVTISGAGVCVCGVPVLLPESVYDCAAAEGSKCREGAAERTERERSCGLLSACGREDRAKVEGKKKN